MAVIFLLFTVIIGLARGAIITDAPTSIINGELTSIDVYPFYAYITFLNGRPHCGGSIIKEDLVLTAAHCLLRRHGKLQVYVGIDHVDQLQDAEPYLVRRKIRHNKYDDKYEDKYDVGLAVLEKNVPIDGFKVALASLAKVAPPVGAQVAIVGFGKVECTYDNEVFDCDNEHSDNLRFALVNVVNVDAEGVIYTQGKSQTTCDGDSGSPVIYDEELVAVVSTGQFDNCTGYDVQAPIAANYPWIEIYLTP